MEPNLLFYQLLLAVLVLICLLIYVWCPEASCHPSNTSLSRDKPRRKRSKEPTPFTGLIHKPLCEACGYRRKYYATNRLTLSAKEVRTLYHKRQEVEEVIRVFKSHLSLEACQAGDKRATADQPYPTEGAQTHHIALWLVAYLIVERTRLDQGGTWRQRKQRLILQGRQHTLPALERVRAAA